MSWFNKKKKGGELDESNLPELPELSEFNLQTQLPEVPPGLSAQDLPELPPIQPASLLGQSSFLQKNEPITSSFLQKNEPITSSFLQKNEPATIKTIQQKKFTPTNYPTRTEPIEGLGMKQIGGIKPRQYSRQSSNSREFEPATQIEEPRFEQPAPRKVEPLYIRLDKFETAVNSINEMQHKIREIEGLLSRTKEIKAREEKELDEWEKEIQGIKSRIDFIDKNVFNKLG